MTHLIHYTLPESDVVVTAEYAWKATGKTDGYYERIECSMGKGDEMVNPEEIGVIVRARSGLPLAWQRVSDVLDRLAQANHADWYAEDDAAMRADVAERRE